METNKQRIYWMFGYITGAVFVKALDGPSVGWFFASIFVGTITLTLLDWFFNSNRTTPKIAKVK